MYSKGESCITNGALQVDRYNVSHPFFTFSAFRARKMGDGGAGPGAVRRPRRATAEVACVPDRKDL